MMDSLEYFKDPNFKFDPDRHQYTYLENGNPVQVFESVSGFIGQFKKPFDSANISKYVARSRGVSQQQILNEWAQTAKEGTDLGSYVHEWIEDFYNGKNPEMPVIPDESEDDFFSNIGLDEPFQFEKKAIDRINKFLHVNSTKLNVMTPKLQEFRIFSKKWGIAGTLDILFELNGKYYIGDWKTNKEFKDDDHPKGRRQKMLYPFDDLWDNNINGYSLQISTYRLILEEEAGFKTDGGFLVWLGPDTPKIYKTLDLRDRIKEFIVKNEYGS
jgi:ATP-dependent exoDNAse (exonuclease V) beta subunit